MPDRFLVEVAPSHHVTAIDYPAATENRAGVTLILGHGAGADQTSGFMVAFAKALAERGMTSSRSIFCTASTAVAFPIQTPDWKAAGAP